MNTHPSTDDIEGGFYRMAHAELPNIAMLYQYNVLSVMLCQSCLRSST